MLRRIETTKLREWFLPAQGVNISVLTLLTLSGLGINQLFQLHPMILTVLKGVCAVYLVYLAWGITQSFKGSFGTQRLSKPVTFVRAMCLQWIHPKAWTMTLTIMSLFPSHGTDSLKSSILVVAVTTAINLPVICIWAGFGSTMNTLLSTPYQRALFGYVMGGFLILMALIVLLE